MIRCVQSTSSAHCKAYFSDALSKADYFLNDQELQGKFEGKLAERLGIKGPATKEAFFAIAENRHPVTDKPLTVRTRDDRITGYDINFHVPKSVSILHVLNNDNHILSAFEESVSETMVDIEADSKTRVRKNGAYDDRMTRELVWANFIHQTARPTDDRSPDMHLHSHCFVFNATWDQVENKFKAAKFRNIKQDMPYYQARFHKRLADKLVDHGYCIRRTRSSFEIEGVPQPVIDHFSKRTNEIGQAAKAKGITNAKDLDALGARTRSKKQKGLTMGQLKAEWRQQIKQLNIDIDDNQPLRFSRPQNMTIDSAARCVDYAVQHSFERASTMADRRLLEIAYKHALGQKAVTIDAITRQFENDQRILKVRTRGRGFCTTKKVLSEEKEMVMLARAGRNKFKPLYGEVPSLKLDEQQSAAVAHVLASTNMISIIRGAAGAGKTTLMKEAVNKIEDAGKKVFVVAPTAQAARGVLKQEGFEQAETVAKLLADQDLQKNLANQVLWVDEAGLLGTSDMLKLLRLATEKNSRLILGGDTRQHSSVSRGDALRILNTVGGIQSAEVNKIYRQKTMHYRTAVEDLSKGNVEAAFNRLDSIQAINEIDPLNPHVDLAKDYVDVLKQKKSALVICPTHQEGENVTDAIRKELRRHKMIGKKEKSVAKLDNLNLTQAQKSDWRNFESGQVIQFNLPSKGATRGSKWIVSTATEKRISLINEKGDRTILPIQKGELYDVFALSSIQLSKGDKVKVNRNVFDENNKRLNNGTMLKVKAVTKEGKIILQNENGKSSYDLKQDFGHLSHAHCLTSHASQGKTVDQVFIAQSSATFDATDAKQFYVSVSRGREAVHIYTDDKAELLEHAKELGERQSALELFSKKEDQEKEVVRNLRIQHMPAVSKSKERSISKSKELERHYEPEF